MKHLFTSIVCLLIFAGGIQATAPGPSPEHIFTSKEGRKFKGRILKYVPIDKMVVFDKTMKRIPLDFFCDEDQEYILYWSMTQGFLSTFTFKIEAQEKLWARRNWKRRTTPFWLEPLRMKGKETPLHVETMIAGYEEVVTARFIAKGYVIRIRNGNSFPLRNITVEHKIFYEQEEFAIGEDIMLCSSNTYPEVVVKQKRTGGSELVEVLEPYKDRILQTKCALLVTYSIHRNLNDNFVEGETAAGVVGVK